ncbi:hypothetical protein BS17DRAFT_808772 [Gyrodon lividus]|nr:hypothetical protein BS17DRAFT_808772 [Gyrodon lividus]
MGHVKQGREWLAEHFHTETDSNEQSAPDVANKQEDDSDPYRDPESPNAFSRIPNKMSDKALTLFLTYKGYHQNRSNGTVEGICAAFKDLWDNVKGDTYHGPWHFNEVRKQWEGNPVNSAEVKDLMTSLKHKAIRSTHCQCQRTTWTRSSIGHKRHVPSLKELSGGCAAVTAQYVCQAEDGCDAPPRANRLWHYSMDLVGKESMFRARKIAEVELDQATIDQVLNKYLAGKELLLSDRMMMFKIHLTNRKGWQWKVDKGLTEQDLCCNHYCIYPQPDLPGTDAFLWLLIWLKWLEFAHYGCTLAPDGCVFPVMGANGIVHPRKPLSHDTIQKWINEAVDDAGIPGFFSTHCFRRGGAQYHFMFAPVGQCWTLAKVHWWGGWAEQEQVSLPDFSQTKSRGCVVALVRAAESARSEESGGIWGNPRGRAMTARAHSNERWANANEHEQIT